MASPVILPKLTYEMLEGRIIEWLATEGETVAPGQTLFTVETDKAAVEVPAEEPGVLLKILVPAGETVPVSTTVAWVGAAGEVVRGQGAGVGGQGSGVRDQSSVVSGQAPASSFQLPASAPAPASTPAPDSSDDQVPASPIARKLARELGVDLREVQAFSGQRRVREADVQAYADAQRAAKPVEPEKAPAPVPVPAPAAARPIPASPAAAPAPAFELVRPTPLQKAMAAHMVRAAAIPQMAAARDVELGALEQLKNALRPGWELAQGYRLTYTHLLAALVARAAAACPTANASWADDGIRFFKDVNLGIAMASERGLVVPVVQDAGRRPLREVAGEITRLQHAAEHNRLPPADLEGGTITMTNVGMLGIALSIPLLNPPQSAIIGVGARREQLVLEGGEVKVKPVMTVTVVADHRVLDGAAVAAFLDRIRQNIEQPGTALGL